MQHGEAGRERKLERRRDRDQRHAQPVADHLQRLYGQTAQGPAPDQPGVLLPGAGPGLLHPQPHPLRHRRSGITPTARGPAGAGPPLGP